MATVSSFEDAPGLIAVEAPDAAEVDVEFIWTLHCGLGDRREKVHSLEPQSAGDKSSRHIDPKREPD